MPRFTAPLLGTYISDHNHLFHRICQITTYTAYVMLIESGLINAHLSDFNNCFLNKGFALLDIDDRALVLYKHDERWYLYYASRGELAKFLHGRMMHTRPYATHVAAACKLLDMDPEGEDLNTKIRTRLLKMIEGAGRRSA